MSAIKTRAKSHGLRTMEKRSNTMRIMPLPTRMLLAFIAAFAGPVMISMLAPTEVEAAHGTGTTYDVGGLEVTTYYTPVESY